MYRSIGWFLCALLVCVSELTCLQEIDCEEGLSLYQGVCLPACENHGDCQNTCELCQHNVCMMDMQCVRCDQHCSNDEMDCSETDLDCGGGECEPCKIGQNCIIPSDCLTKTCKNNLCTEPEPEHSCTDNQKNGNETDLDCGGLDCEQCVLGQRCNTGVDCLSGICPDGVCRPEAPTWLMAMPKGSGKIYLGWRMVSRYENDAYNVYRGTTNAGPYEKINSQPIVDSTNFIDTNVEDNMTYFYVVRLIVNAVESHNSNQVEVVASASTSNRYLATSTFFPNPKADNHCNVKVGDVTGDGLMDYLVIISDDKDSAGNPIEATLQVGVFDHYGEKLWGPYDSGLLYVGEFPWTFADLDGDGAEEAVGVVCDRAADTMKLAAFDHNGMQLIESENIPHQYPISAKSNRVYITVAYLDGINPYIITHLGCYPDRKNWIRAYDRNLELVWSWYRAGNPNSKLTPKYNGFLPNDSPLNYGGSHMIRSADLDGDGKDEVLHGTNVFNGYTGPEPNVVWRKHIPHPDGTIPADIRPDIPGLEIFYHIEQGALASMLVDKDGNTLWHGGVHFEATCPSCGHVDPSRTVKHGHAGWAADFMPNYPGKECWVHYIFDARCDACGVTNEWDKRYVFSAKGDVVGKSHYNQPLEWDGDEELESIPTPGAGIRHAVLRADVIGDYREEFLVVKMTADGEALTGDFWIYTNTDLNPTKKPAFWEKRLYYLDQRWTGYRW